jgi:antitoxin VapB
VREKTLNIRNPEATRLARRLAAVEGRSITEALTDALRERLARHERHATRRGTRSSVARIQALVAALPEQNRRSADEILGYDGHGLPS